MADTTITLIGVREADTGLHKFAAGVEDWRPFWRLLSERLADTAQSRWPLRRRTGTLRRSLTWAGNRLGWAGVYESAPDRLRFGSDLFYAKFPQRGTRKQKATPLIHIDPKQHNAQLEIWLNARASAAGLEVT